MCDGTRADGIDGVEVVARPALGNDVPDVLAADAYLLGMPADLGTMSGALKHCFDTIYCPCLDVTRGRLYGVFVHGNTTSTAPWPISPRSLAASTGREAQAPVRVTGEHFRADLDACWELGAALAAGLMG